MKTIVFVDGENLRHKLAEVLKTHQKISHGQDLKKFDVRGLISAIIPDFADFEVRYFGAKVAVLGSSKATRAKTLAIIQQKRAWNSTLKGQDIRYFEVGALRLRKNSQSAGAEYLVEKGADVGMAIDMVVAALKKDVDRIVFISSDADLLPAIQALRLEKVDTTYIAHETFILPSLSQFATRTRVFSDTQIISFFESKNNKKVT